MTIVPGPTIAYTGRSCFASSVSLCVCVCVMQVLQREVRRWYTDEGHSDAVRDDDFKLLEAKEQVCNIHTHKHKRTHTHKHTHTQSIISPLCAVHSLELIQKQTEHARRERENDKPDKRPVSLLWSHSQCVYVCVCVSVCTCSRPTPTSTVTWCTLSSGRQITPRLSSM